MIKTNRLIRSAISPRFIAIKNQENNRKHNNLNNIVFHVEQFLRII